MTDPIQCPRCGAIIEYCESDPDFEPNYIWTGYMCESCDYEDIEWIVYGQPFDDMRKQREAMERIVTAKKAENHDRQN